MQPPNDDPLRRGDARPPRPKLKRTRDATVKPGPHVPQPTQSTRVAAPDRRTQALETIKTEVSTTKLRRDVLKRQEKMALTDQVRELEDQLNQLRSRVGLPTREDKQELDQVRTQSTDLDELLHVNAQYLGRLDSMITHELLSPPVSTLSTFIHLPRDMETRRMILRGMQELKLRRGIEVGTEWARDLDHTVPYLDETAFTTASGEYHYRRVEFDQYPNFKTARQFYNTLVQFLYNLEISVTEGLGNLTLREDLDDMVDPTVWNPRFVTVTEGIGIPEELNFVFFAQFYPYSPYTNSPMGIVITDTVNVDDLYPYIPEERTCRDCQAVHMVFEVPKPGTNETIVVFKQLRFCVQLRPMFEIAPDVFEKLCQNFGNWPNYFVKYFHEYVVTEKA